MPAKQTAAVIYWYPEDGMPRDGGGIRALAWVHTLRELGFDARVQPLQELPTGTGRPSMLRRAKQSLLPMPLIRKTPYYGADLVVATVPGTFPSVTSSLPKTTPVILDWMDRWSVNARTMANSSPLRLPGAYAQSIAWRLRERNLPKRAWWNTFAGHSDWSAMSPSRGTWLPTPITPGDSPRVDARVVKRVGFIGNLKYEPNELSLRWFFEKYAASFRGAGIEIIVAGIDTDRVRDWNYGATVIGPVNDVQTFYEQIDASIVPIEYGGGIKVKAVEALLHGVPVIATEHVLHGFDRSLIGGSITLLDDFVRAPRGALQVTNQDQLSRTFSIDTFTGKVDDMLQKMLRADHNA